MSIAAPPAVRSRSCDADAGRCNFPARFRHQAFCLGNADAACRGSKMSVDDPVTPLVPDFPPRLTMAGAGTSPSGSS